jgi:hypothetical protein
MISGLRRVAPALCVLIAAAAYLGWVLARGGGDPLAFADLGTRYSELQPGGTEGYDGQFNYYIAEDPNPASVRARLDVPAYRYQHILYPLLARAIALGQGAAIPWVLVLFNLVCLTAATYLAGDVLELAGGSRWAALLIGLWAGLLGAVRLDLAEPLAILLVVLALRIAGLDFRKLALAMLTKETVLPFVAGWALLLLAHKEWRKAGILLAGLVPFALLQVWLFAVFGQIGLGSGGSGATPFEWLPFAGLVQVAATSSKAFLALAVVYLPGVLLPCAYGIGAPLADLARRRITLPGCLLFFNALMVLLAPFSTYREPLGILRLATGMILALWLYTTANKMEWWSKLGLVTLAYLPFLLN